MANKNATGAIDYQAVTIDGTTGMLEPTHMIIHLKNADNVRLELSKVYRDMRHGVIDAGDGTKFAYVLGQIGKMIESYDLETRLDLLEGIKNGND